MKKSIIFIAALLFSGGLFAQQTWTLGSCIDYALKNNLQIKKQVVANEQQKIDLNTAKNSRLPSVSGNASQRFSFGRAIDQNNSYVNKNSSNTNFGISASIPLFTGYEISNNIALSKINLMAATEDLNKAKEDISVAVASAYLQVLFKNELIKVAQEQIKFSKEQLDRITRMEEVGKASPAQVYEAKARLAQDELVAVQAVNDHRLATLELTQLLELPSPEGFVVASPDLEPTFAPLTLPEEIFVEAMNNRPGVLAAKYRLDGVEKSIKIAKSAYYPSLTLDGGLSTSYYTVSGLSMEGFGKQLSNNFGQYVGLTLSIPIFNKFQTRNKVKSARLQYDTQAYQFEDSKKVLYKEIQQAYYSALGAEAKYTSSKTAVQASEESFKLMREKYENGKATSVEFNETKMNLMKSASERIQAKYDYLFRTKILDFYKGISLAQ